MRLIGPALPYLRSVRHWRLYRHACRQARLATEAGALVPPPAFIVGCGRSGTTALGRALRGHPELTYLFEPYHLWAAIEPSTDVTSLYCDADSPFIMSAEHASPEAQARFALLMDEERARGTRLLEKTPHNVARIGFLERIAPGARYVHIVRDGVDVSRSISRVAQATDYRIAGRPRYNIWWGTRRCKWAAILRDGRRVGCFPEEAAGLRTEAQRGAYEWILSLGEAERWKARIGDRFLEITYTGVIHSPRKHLERICAFFGLGAPRPWLDSAAASLSGQRKRAGEPLALPPGLARRFNELQERYGFDGRAEPLRAAS